MHVNYRSQTHRPGLQNRKQLKSIRSRVRDDVLLPAQIIDIQYVVRNLQ